MEVDLDADMFDGCRIGLFGAKVFLDIAEWVICFVFKV